MTSAPKTRGTTAPKRHRQHDPEERFQMWVTIGFIALIAAVVITIVVGIGYSFWQQHWQPVASVGGASISKDQWADRGKLELFRLDQQEGRIRTALAAGQISSTDADTRLSDIATAKTNVATTAIDNLIDLTFQGQLATKQGVAPATDADVDNAVTADATSPEQRAIDVIFVTPGGANPTTAPTPQDRQNAYTAIHAAADALAAGTPFETVAAQYSTDASKAKGGSYGTVTRSSSLDPTFLEALFALPQDGTTGIITGADGTYRIGKVAAITPGTLDTTFQSEVQQRLSWDTYRSNVRMEAFAQKLKDSIVAGASGQQDQVHAAEIFLSGDPTKTGTADSGQVKASHILYSPNNDPQAATTLAADDPAWAAAEAEANLAAAQLRAISDTDSRIKDFGVRAQMQSDDTGSGANGGELGFFTRDQMVTEFANAVFDDPTLKKGDIVGPVKTQYGWHVILYEDRIPPLQDRVDAVKTELAKPDADFGAIAAASSDGAEAIVKGDLGWLTRDQLDSTARDAVMGLAVGAVSDPIAQSDGYHIYKVAEKASRPLDPAQAAAVAASAFGTWYDPQKATAQTDGTITQDPSTLPSTSSGN